MSPFEQRRPRSARSPAPSGAHPPSEHALTSLRSRRPRTVSARGPHLLAARFTRRSLVPRASLARGSLRSPLARFETSLRSVSRRSALVVRPRPRVASLAVHRVHRSLKSRPLCGRPRNAPRSLFEALPAVAPRTARKRAPPRGYCNSSLCRSIVIAFRKTNHNSNFPTGFLIVRLEAQSNEGRVRPATGGLDEVHEALAYCYRNIDEMILEGSVRRVCNGQPQSDTPRGTTRRTRPTSLYSVARDTDT